MIRTVHLTDSISRRAGGMFESLRSLCSTLNASPSITAEVFACKDEFTDFDQSMWDRVPTHIAEKVTSRTAIGHVGGGVAIYCKLRSSSFDLAHLHGIWGAASLSMALWRMNGTKRPYIISPHGMLEAWALRTKSFKKSIGWWLWQGKLLKQATCIHALGEDEAASIANLNLGRPICVIPNGVALPETTRAKTQTLKTLLFLGRIHPKKGLEELLRAFARIEESKRINWRILIAGWDDGGHLFALRSLAKGLAIGTSIEFVGPVFGLEKEHIFRSSTAFILPSHSEGLPMAVLEAWSYGLPVIISNECHLDIGFQRGAAIKVAPNVPSIEFGLRALFTKTAVDLEAMGEKGRILVAQHYTWVRVVEQFALVYQWMLGGPKPECLL